MPTFLKMSEECHAVAIVVIRDQYDEEYGLERYPVSFTAGLTKNEVISGA